jgi:hypothetical protein
LLIGQLADAYGLRAGMVLLYLTFGYVLSVGFWARPLVHNALLGGRETSDRSANRARQPSSAAKGIER